MNIHEDLISLQGFLTSKGAGFDYHQRSGYNFSQLHVSRPLLPLSDTMVKMGIRSVGVTVRGYLAIIVLFGCVVLKKISDTPPKTNMEPTN